MKYNKLFRNLQEETIRQVRRICLRIDLEQRKNREMTFSNSIE